MPQADLTQVLALGPQQEEHLRKTISLRAIPEGSFLPQPQGEHCVVW